MKTLLFLIPLIYTATCLADPVAAETKKVKPKREKSAIIFLGKPEGEGKLTRLFILSGQSNMAGLNHRSSFIPLIEKAFPDDTLIVVKDAQSGQPIRRWAKDWQPVGDWTPKNPRSQPGNNDLYQRLIAMVTQATEGKTIDSVSFVWMQGEADAKKQQSTNYAEALTGLIQQIRNDTGHETITVVVGRISDHLKNDEHWDRVREAQMAICEADAHATWIDTDAYNGKNDGLHYNGDGYQKLGEDFANATIELLK